MSFSPPEGRGRSAARVADRFEAQDDRFFLQLVVGARWFLAAGE